MPFPVPLPTRALAAVAAAAVLAVSGCASGTAPPKTITSNDPLVQTLSGQVAGPGAMEHLQALQKVADANGGHRSAGSAGYDASVDYVVGVLQRAGFQVDTPTYRSEESGRTQRNVVAQTRSGDTGQVVMIGAHLDSVPEGPGIVDNGSGVATLLEIATRLGPDPKVRNAVRFAFFGDEETDLTGSTSYVDGLSSQERGAIKLYLNVDMTASPNGGYFVQGGVGDGEEATGPAGSATVAQVFADQLKAVGVTSQFIEFVGDDETPFIKAGIPVAGAENGDRKRKTDEEAQAWGGRSGERYDPCYHQACDTIGNVNQELLVNYLKGIAGTVAVFATSTDELR